MYGLQSSFSISPTKILSDTLNRHATPLISPTKRWNDSGATSLFRYSLSLSSIIHSRIFSGNEVHCLELADSVLFPVLKIKTTLTPAQVCLASSALLTASSFSSQRQSSSRPGDLNSTETNRCSLTISFLSLSLNSLLAIFILAFPGQRSFP